MKRINYLDFGSFTWTTCVQLNSVEWCEWRKFVVAMKVHTTRRSNSPHKYPRWSSSMFLIRVVIANNLSQTSLQRYPVENA